MKKVISIFLSALILLTSLSTLTFAEDLASGTCGDNLTWTLSSDGVLTISGTGEMYDCGRVWDETTETYIVNQTPWKAHADSIVKIVVEDGVTNVGKFAFCKLTANGYDYKIEPLPNVSEIVLPDTITDIKERAFICSSLNSITIPDSVMSISYDAFSDCTGLTNIYVDDNNSEYADVDGVLFTKDIKTILCYPAGRTNADYTIPDSVVSIGNQAFFGSKVTSVAIPYGVTSIGISAFGGCADLLDLDIPNSVTYIGNSAFSGCYSLKTNIPDSVTTIGGDAFSFCLGLIDVTVPESVMAIDYSTFYGCSSLKTITFESATTEICDEEYTIPETTVIYGYNGSTAQAYAQKYGREFVSLGDVPSPEDLSGVCGDNLTWTLSSDGVLTISGTGKMTSFSYGSAPWHSKCTAIKSVIIESGVTSIGSGAFADCSNLTDISIPETVTSIEPGAFLFCASLESVSIPNGVTTIEVETFVACTSLTSVNIPNSVTEISEGAFAECIALTEITLPESLKKINNNAFIGCTALTSITIPKNVENVGRRAFDACTSLASIKFESATTVIFDASSTIPETTVIYGYNNSIAKAYAEGYGREFVSLGDAPMITGDVSNDGELNNADAIYLLYNVIFGNSDYPVNQDCDFNGDGDVSNADAIYLLYHVIFGETLYPLG